MRGFVLRFQLYATVCAIYLVEMIVAFDSKNNEFSHVWESKKGPKC